MSQENVEVMRAAIEAFNRRDGDRFGALLDNHAEIVPVRAALEGTVYRGPTAGAQYCAAVESSWENLILEVEKSGTATVGFSRWVVFKAAAGAVAQPLMRMELGLLTSETGWSHASAPIPIVKKPSKPWGWRGSLIRRSFSSRDSTRVLAVFGRFTVTSPTSMTAVTPRPQARASWKSS